jgi:hypothetical protein
MSVLSIAQWLQSGEFPTYIRESGLTYPVIMTLHLCGMALFGGMILMTDLRLLGLALKDYSIADVVGGLRNWKRLGFVWVVTCGALLGWSEAEKYSGNPYFWIKMTLLTLVGVHALIFRPMVYNHPEELDRAPKIPTRAKAAACISLLLWSGLVCAGRWIGYYEAPRSPGAPVSLADSK